MRASSLPEHWNFPHDIKPTTQHSTSVLAADARDLLDHLQWDKVSLLHSPALSRISLEANRVPVQVHVVGISMGGMISQELALMLLPAKRLLSLALAVTHAGSVAWSLLPLSSC